MDLASYRNGRGLSQEECASELGLASKGYISGIESGSQPASLRLSLQIQIWSRGEVQATEVAADADRQLLLEATTFARVAA